MSGSALLAQQAPPNRILDRFLQEANIKWLLYIGIAILLGSSLMLVASHWQAFTPSWQFATMFGYTALVYLSSQWSYHRLILRKTGTVLMVLTVLLLPVLFLALHWVDGLGALHFLFLAICSAFTWYATTQIFGLWLHGPQPTFQASYLLLCLSAALMPALGAVAAPGASLLLWGIFTIGVIKVNRHVFWLTEHLQLPKIFGFFPIALLASIFGMVFGLNFAAHIALELFGLGAALMAVPILSIAITLAAIHRQRTGDLAVTLPLAVLAPLMVGITLCATALALALVGLAPGHAPQAVSPTALIVSAILAYSGVSLRKSLLIWIAIFAFTLAYNFSPVFFLSLVQQGLHSGAALVGESQLPYAFYGLTFLPLILFFTGSTIFAQRAGHTLFVKPLQIFSIALPLGLVVLALTHAKAVLPVIATLSLVFILQSWLFKRRWLALAAVVSGFIALFSLSLFIEQVLHLPFPMNATLLSIAIGALWLRLFGPTIDQKINQWQTTSSPRRTFLVCQDSSLAITLALSCFWLLQSCNLYIFSKIPLNYSLGLVLLALLIVHNLRRHSSWLNGLILLSAHILLAQSAFYAQVTINGIVSITTLALFGQWLWQNYFHPHPKSQGAVAFARANHIFVAMGLRGMLLLYSLWWLTVAFFALGDKWQAIGPWSLSQFAMMLWSLDMARKNGLLRWAFFAIAAALGVIGSLWLSQFPGLWLLQSPSLGQAYLPALYSGSLLLLLLVTKKAENPIFCQQLARTSIAILALLSLLPLFLYTPAIQLAGLFIALAFAYIVGSYAAKKARFSEKMALFSLSILNGLALALMLSWFAPTGITSAAGLLHVGAIEIFIPLAIIAALSLHGWRKLSQTGSVLAQKTSQLQRMIYGFISWISLVSSLGMADPQLSTLLGAGVALGLLSADRLILACQQQNETLVWFGLALFAAIFGYFIWFDLIQFGNGWSLFITLGLAALSGATAHFCRQWPALATMARPLSQLAFILPTTTVALAVYQHFSHTTTSWLGKNSLALLFAAGYYFWYGLERSRPRFLVFAAVIANIALVFLLRELVWSDPQFYMIPIGITVLALSHALRKQMPPSYLNPSYYLGALIILVSPIFHIATGSWLHLFSLMVVSVFVVLAAISFRVRALLYTGTAFLIADLVAMIARGSIDHPDLLWFAGLALGGAIVALGALAEHKRERLLQQLRALSATSQGWN